MFLEERIDTPHHGKVPDADRERRRAALAAAPDWLACLPRVRAPMLTQDTRIPKPAGFFADRVRTQLETQP